MQTIKTDKNTSVNIRGIQPALLLLVIIHSIAFARLPDSIPGEEISDREYMNHLIPSDSLKKSAPDKSPHSATWLDKVQEAWDAPPLSKQLAADQTTMKFGMGAVFIPRMSNSQLEPVIEIMDPNGEIRARGKPGNKYSLLPGTYFVMLGSGSQNHKIVRKVTVEENRVTPLIPDWSGLTIETLDENNMPFRGEYEIAKIDNFEPYGRGYGENPDLGEKARTWILKPGIYKIFEVGESYNTMKNFITVRLLPGEYVKTVLIFKDENNMEIIGGGMIYSEIKKEFTKNWTYSLNIGGSIDFNSQNDIINDSTDISTSFSTLTNLRLEYTKDKIEWENRFKLDESLDMKKFDFRSLDNPTDEILFMSLFTWKFFPWLGPYGRTEFETGLFPEYIRVPEKGSKYYFGICDENNTLQNIDSTSASIKLGPSLSPFSIEIGLGANMTAADLRYFKTKVLIGFGYKQEWAWKQSEVVDSIIVDSDTSETEYFFLDSIQNKTIIKKNLDAATSPEYGPEAALYSRASLGRIADVESDFKVFSPVKRFSRPDIRWRTTLSLKLTKFITLDYQYEYRLRRPEGEESLHEKLSKHRVLIRFSITSR